MRLWITRKIFTGHNYWLFEELALSWKIKSYERWVRDMIHRELEISDVTAPTGWDCINGRACFSLLLYTVLLVQWWIRHSHTLTNAYLKLLVRYSRINLAQRGVYEYVFIYWHETTPQLRGWMVHERAGPVGGVDTPNNPGTPNEHPLVHAYPLSRIFLPLESARRKNTLHSLSGVDSRREIDVAPFAVVKFSTS